MARKYDLISELYARTCKTVVMYPQNWEAFLRSACRNYKLRFDEQLLVYAQRPDATAVLEIERWNKKFGRWVNRGAHGIAVFEDAEQSRQRLIHYFDISDTHESRFSRPVPIWQMKPEYTEDIIDTLESTFGELSDKDSLEAAILSAAKNAVEDNIPDYLSDLFYSVENSLLDGVSEEEISVIYRETVQNSVAYMLMSRLGLDTEGIFEPDDFRGAVNFTTPQTLNALGFATSDIAEMGLAEIARTITALDRQNRIIAGNGKADYNIGREKNERSFENGRDQIYNAGRLSASQPDNAQAAGSELRQIRSDEEEVSEGTPQSPLLQSADELHPDRTLGGDGAESLDDGGNADKADGSEGRNHGEPESGGYDVVGTADEQSEKQSTGNREGGSNLRLVYDRQHEDKSFPFFGGDEVINEILGTTPHLKASKDEIRAFYENTPDDTARTEFIKGIFNDDYTELILSDGRRVGYKTFENGLHFWEGSYLSRTAQSFYDWGVVAKHFEAMRLLGELQDTTKPLPSINGQLTLMLEAEDKKFSAFTFSQEIIDAVLTRGSGISEGKFRIYEQFEKSLSAKENADFLKKEYGWGGVCPAIIGTGIDEQHNGKGITISKGIGDDKPHINLKWNQVEKRIAELIRIDRYLNPKEKAFYPEWLQKQEERRAELAEERKNREILSTAPPEKKPEEQGGFEYNGYHFVPIGKIDSESTLQEIANVTVSKNSLGMSVYDGSRLPYSYDEFYLAAQQSDADVFRCVETGKSYLPGTNELFEYIGEFTSLTAEKQIETTQAEYEYHLGDTVYIGADEYEILSFDDERVMLHDMQYPLFQKEVDRAEFDRKVQENPMNDHLKVTEPMSKQTTDEESEIRFSSIEFEKLIPYHMRFKETDLVNGNEMYWVTQGIFNAGDLRDFQQAVKKYDGNIKKFYVTSRDISSYNFEEDMANKALATVTPDTILKDDYIHAIEKAGLSEYLYSEISEEVVEERQTDDPNTTPIGDEDYYFHRPGMGKFEAIYYNPDSNAGGQFVVLHIPYKLIEEAKAGSNSVSGFYEYLDSKAYTELIDVGTQEFSDYLEAYAEPEPDYIGRTEETMQALISQTERVSYDIGMGYLGNGLTVWNRAVEEHGDYQTIAHISNEGEIKYYVDGLPDDVVAKIEKSAEQEQQKALFAANYKIGSKVYLDGKPFEIVKTNDWNVVLMDRSLQNPTPRLEPKESFMQLVWQNEYSKIKAENNNAIVLYQVGDFFELYGNDATYMSDTFALNLTNKTMGSEQVSMCAIPSNQLETYLNMLTDRGNDVVIAALENGKRITRTVVSTNKEDPIQSQPVGRIEYLDEDGNVIHTDEYTSEYQFKKDIDEESSFGTRFRFYVYRNAEGKTIDQTFITKMDTPLNVYEIIDSPYLAQEQQIEETHTEETKPEPLTPSFEKPKRTRVQTFDLHPDIPMSERHTFDLASHEVEEVGKKERFRRNLMAIQLLKKCQEENRFATPEEQEILSKYVGWGGIPEAFDENNSSWATEFLELSAVLTPDEYESAKASVLTAFYTPPAVISAIYKAMEQMGFREGNILEPSCGIGNFIGMLPQSMQEAKMYGVEIDKISAGIAQQLYQKTSIAALAFEEANVPDSFFDAVVGNVPFGDIRINDRRYNKHNFLIHDYFFAKSLDKLRPGGVMALVTSKGTMDKENSAVRKYIAQRADLLGAIRLPNNTFKGNAGTEVVSDILILQKRDRIMDIEPEWVHLNTDENGFKMNAYFVDHPEMVLGEWKTVSGRFGDENTVVPYENADLAAQLDEAISNIHAEITAYETEEELEEEDTSIPADPNVRNFSYTVVDEKIYYRENSRMTPVDCSATAENRIKGMIDIRDSVRNLLEIQTLDYPDWEVEKEQQKLNELYDTFSKKYGLINSRANVSAFSQDSSFSLISALEVLDEEGNLERKADMFTKRTIKTHTPVTSVDTASEALAVSMGEKARVDMEYMCELTGKSEQEIYQDLKGVIFLNPMHGYGGSAEAKYLMADEYLSGNVREKLAWAKRSAEVYPEDFKTNVEALEKVQPTDLTASEIFVQLGTTWLPEEIVQQFIYEFLDTPLWARYNIKVHYSKFTSEWNVEGKSYDRSNVKAYNSYGTSRINAYKIIEETLNMKDVRIFDYIEDDEGKKKAVLNNKETQIAQAKQELIKQGFKDWIWNDPDRREKLVRLYNDKFNSIRPREYDGSHIIFSGMNPEIELREHQKNAVAHILYGGNTLLAHAVGAGKTFEMTAAAMESKRLGLCSKSLFVVQNHLTEQWAAEFLQLYPAANILVATKKDFEMKNRKRFCGRIATGDYDAVIIGHSQFEKIPMSFERQRMILQEQIRDITNGIIDLKANRGDKFSVKQLEKTKKSLSVKLEKLNDQSRKDDVVTFEELGIDRLFIDESHYYKNLFLYTKMRNVGGIAQTEAQKSSDLFMKCRYLDELTGGRGVVFATGTPISNSMVELYTIQRYLQYNTLEKHDLQHFDAWASNYGETVVVTELKPEGTGYRSKTRFARFNNLPELMAMFKEVADIKTADMLDLPVPEVEYHNIAVKPSQIQKDMVASLAERAEAIRAGGIDARIDNMLKITNDGRKLALDQRMLNEMLPDDEGSKVNACINEVYRIWEENTDKRSTQLLFCDLSTPKGEGVFSVYTDIRKKLIERGIPESEIRFIHEADTEVKKQELFKKVRKGEVRILLGSTQKMGAGTNVQNKIIASHDIDCPWRPSDVGRILRTFKIKKNVEVTDNGKDDF